MINRESILSILQAMGNSTCSLECILNNLTTHELSETNDAMMSTSGANQQLSDATNDLSNAIHLLKCIKSRGYC